MQTSQSTEECRQIIFAKDLLNKIYSDDVDDEDRWATNVATGK